MTKLLRHAALAACVCWMTSPVLAQDAALVAAAESYISSPSQQDMIDRLLSPDSIRAQISSARPDIPVDLLVEVGKIASEELLAVRPQLEKSMVDAAVETFTLEEIEALDAFYRTPEGQSVLIKNATFMQTAMNSIAPEMRQVQQEIFTRVQQIIPSQN